MKVYYNGLLTKIAATVVSEHDDMLLLRISNPFPRFFRRGQLVYAPSSAVTPRG